MEEKIMEEKIMEEKFTDRVKLVMVLANQEAQKLNHEFIGTEHLLLAVIKENSGIGIYLLKQLKIDLNNIRIAIEKSMTEGPNMVSTGQLPWTPRTKKVMELTIDFSNKLNDKHVGTEHLIYGLLAEESSVASQVFKNEGLTKKKYEGQFNIIFEESCENCVCFPVCQIAHYIQKTPMIAIAKHRQIEETVQSIRRKFYKILQESCTYYLEKNDETE